MFWLCKKVESVVLVNITYKMNKNILYLSIYILTALSYFNPVKHFSNPVYTNNAIICIINVQFSMSC